MYPGLRYVTPSDSGLGFNDSYSMGSGRYPAMSSASLDFCPHVVHVSLQHGENVIFSMFWDLGTKPVSGHNVFVISIMLFNDDFPIHIFPNDSQV